MLAIDSHTAHIWILDLASISARPDLLESYRALLSREEADRLQRFAFSKLQHHYLATRALLRTSLSHYADISPVQWRFAQDKNGKPYLLNSPIPLSFNLSHTGERAVLAVTLGNRIGVDIEQLSRKRDWMGIAEHYFHQREVDALLALPEPQQAQHFFRLWTLKEAYLKARGTGIATGLDKAAFELAPGKVQVYFAPELDASAAEWHFFNYQLGEDYSLSLACHLPLNGPAPQLRFYQSWPLMTGQPGEAPVDQLTDLAARPEGNEHLA